MTIGTHHEEGAGRSFDHGSNCLFRFPLHDRQFDIPIPGQGVACHCQQLAMPFVIRANRDDMNWQTCEQRRVGHALQGVSSRFAAVICQHDRLRHFDRAGCDQDRFGTGPHNPLNLRSDLIRREFMAGTTLADHHHPRVRFAFDDGSDDSAMAMQWHRRFRTACLKPFSHRRQKDAATSNL